ncbi:hypothetical protein EDB95_3851 [Dinghuibacter silviterrae]|uniref:SatD family protein n=2 Tax=Dinghuibacter silviterrae TaxID=1539049 RepID=A0A4R8DEQ2_9BACT|nr:hypothetical protein EDB95_3851 [Dinghuibacter silviterrae]
MVAVLTGDIIRSSDLSPEKREELQVVLNQGFAEVTRLSPSFRAEQFRGDSFQGILDPQEGLRALLLLINFLYLRQFGVRIALGLGTVSYESDSILTSDGSAFQASGPALDDLKKKNQLLAIAGPSDSFNQEWRVHALTLDYLLSRWTIPQAEAVLGALQGYTQEETARQLGIRQPAVQQRLQAVGWPVMEAILERFVPFTHATHL